MPEEGPEDAPEQRPGKAWLFKLTAVALVCLSVAAGWLLMSQHQMLQTPLVVPSEGVVIEVRPGLSLRQVTRDLEARGVLSQPYFLVWHARWHGTAGAIKAGEYRIAPDSTPLDLLDQLIAGKVIQHPLTVVEGWTFNQLMAVVNANGYLTHTLDGNAPAEIMSRLGFAEVHPEGRFFADTYHFPRGTSDVEFLRRAYQKMADYLAAAWPGRSEGLPLQSPEQALILASIVEKETGTAGERPRIAGVFVRRLERGMRLETDPTVIYGLGDAFDGNLRRRDLRQDTPYNTYVRKGLPPTPIAIPSAAAIHAVLHPDSEDALFFVAKGDGSHHFSATYEEHRKAVTRYQKGGRRKPSSRADD